MQTLPPLTRSATPAPEPWLRRIWPAIKERVFVYSFTAVACASIWALTEYGVSQGWGDAPHFRDVHRYAIGLGGSIYDPVQELVLVDGARAERFLAMARSSWSCFERARYPIAPDDPRPDVQWECKLDGATLRVNLSWRSRYLAPSGRPGYRISSLQVHEP